MFGGSKSKRFLTRKPKDRLYQAYLHVKAQELNNRKVDWFVTFTRTDTCL